ncbi:MAG: lamin tail domain-containing protein [Methanothrix sp.]|nr:lamin tail domain-containing protein [Methanothrix sp.]
MKRSKKYGLVLVTMLMALSIGVAFGENVTTADKMMPSNVVNVATAGSNANVADAADAKEKEAVDKNETGEDNVIIDNVTFSTTTQYVELKNNETSGQDLTGWKLEVQNKAVFTFPKFMLDANATVAVHTGTGKDSKTDLYATNSLISKSDEEVSLRDANGAIVSTSEEPNETSDKPTDA